MRDAYYVDEQERYIAASWRRVGVAGRLSCPVAGTGLYLFCRNGTLGIYGLAGSYRVQCQLGTYANMTRPPPPDERPPFLSDCISPPPVHWQSFKQPSLRRCPFAPDTIKWCAMVGYGSQGCVFRVQFGNKGPFAVKIVRRQTPTASSATAS